MKICIFGQGTGGNASIWFDYLNSKQSKSNLINVTFICRTIKTLQAKFNTISPYGTGKIPSFLFRFYVPFISRVGMRFVVKFNRLFNKYDALILQGNYAPSLNLIVMKGLKCHTIVNIYGSDFYRKYLLNEFSDKERRNFVKVLECADNIVLNWTSSYNDFLREFPEFSEKCTVKPWGVGDSWITAPVLPKKQLESKLAEFKWPKADKVFLSARALYDYNNIEIVVESFCKAFHNNKNYKLFIVNGYGNHRESIEKVNSIITKFDARDQVITKIGEWISDEELQYLYHRADYNFCFGSTDQLTVSVIYSFLSKTINILSPIPGYKDLVPRGYRSPLIANELTTCSLKKLLSNLTSSEKESASEEDKVKALEEFNMESTFSHYISLVK